jgi:nucleotide-binding universal stress UspA family protein
MPAAFKNILIPVDFSINTEVAVKKALELIEPQHSMIYLLHVQKLTPRIIRIIKIIFGKDNSTSQKAMSKLRFNELHNLICESCPSIEVVREQKKAKGIEKTIIEKANNIKPDIIVIGKHSHHIWFPFLNTVFPNRIAKSTGCPVLTVKPGSIYNRIKSIVVPVGSAIPKRKVELIVALKKKFRISIHLVTVMGNKSDSNEFSAYALLSTYRFLRDAVQCPLDHEVLHGDNVAKSAFKYAQNIKADILLVDPESETRLSTFPDKHISDELKADSRLQILTVQP